MLANSNIERESMLTGGYDFPEATSAELGNPNMAMKGSSKGWSSGLPTILSSARDNAKKGVGRIGKFVKAGKGAEECPDLDAKTVHKYEFSCGGREVEVALAHADSVWYIILDSEVVATMDHKDTHNTPMKAAKSFSTSLDFSIPQSTHERCYPPLEAKMKMEWVPRSMRWRYELMVHNSVVPPYWSKGAGLVQDHQVLQIA